MCFKLVQKIILMKHGFVRFKLVEKIFPSSFQIDLTLSSFQIDLTYLRCSFLVSKNMYFAENLDKKLGTTLLLQ